MKIKVFLFAFNRPDFLERQIECIHKFLTNRNQIYVIHDSRNDEYVSDFLPICEKYNVEFFHNNSLPGKSPSDYHSSSVQWAYDNIMLKKCTDDFVIILDHDMFLIDQFDVEQYMIGYDVAGCLQKRKDVKYLWPGLTILNMNSISNIQFTFSNGYFNGQMLDTGGGTCKLLSQEGIKYKDTGVEYPDEYENINLKDPSISNGFNFELHLDGKFLHYRNACSWHNNMVLTDLKKTQTVFKILNDFVETNG